MKILLLSFIFIQIGIFAIVYNHYNTSYEFKCVCQKYKIPFPLARASATLINFNLLFTLLSIIRLPKRWIFISFKLKHLHIFFAICLCIWSIIHTIAHYNTFIRFRYDLITSSIGISGHILLLLLLTLSVLSLSYFRRRMYQFFLYSHYILFILFIVALLIHGNLCFLRNDNKDCLISSSWIWILVPFIYLFGYTIYKFTRKVKMLSLRNLNNGICELKLDIGREYAGKTVWLCCPKISYLEWHPFTVAFYRNGCYLYFKVRGDWTTKLKDKINDNPSFLIEGPYHALPKNLMKVISNKQVVLISSGVGITTFINTYRQLAKDLKRNNLNICKLYIYIIVRYEHELNWVIEIFELLNKINNVNIRLYYTGEESYKLINLNLPHNIGRPDFKEIFEYHIPSSKTDIYYSGKTTLGRQINGYSKHKQDFTFHYVN